VSVTVAACCIVPDVPVTLTVNVSGTEYGSTSAQPDSMTAPNATTRIEISRQLLRLLHSRKQLASASVEPGIHGWPLRSSCACALALSVSCAVIAPPDGVTVGGLKEQVAPRGRPEQAKLTGALNPMSGVTVTVTTPLPRTARGKYNTSEASKHFALILCRNKPHAG
jgi:hypothetical protein